jgi:hypothetical protein
MPAAAAGGAGGAGGGERERTPVVGPSVRNGRAFGDGAASLPKRSGARAGAGSGDSSSNGGGADVGGSWGQKGYTASAGASIAAAEDFTPTLLNALGVRVEGLVSPGFMTQPHAETVRT